MQMKVWYYNGTENLLMHFESFLCIFAFVRLQSFLANLQQFVIVYLFCACVRI